MSDNSFSERHFPPKTRPIPHNTTENTEKKKGKKNPFGKYIFRIFRKDINLKDMKGQLQPTPKRMIQELCIKRFTAR